MTQYHNYPEFDAKFLSNLKQRINDFFLLNNPDLIGFKQDCENILRDLKVNIIFLFFFCKI